MFSDDERDKVFNANMVQTELLVNHAVAPLYVKEVLGRGYLNFNYYDFEKIVCAYIDLE